MRFMCQAVVAAARVEYVEFEHVDEGKQVLPRIGRRDDRPRASRAVAARIPPAERPRANRVLGNAQVERRIGGAVRRNLPRVSPAVDVSAARFVHHCEVPGSNSWADVTPSQVESRVSSGPQSSAYPSSRQTGRRGGPACPLQHTWRRLRAAVTRSDIECPMSNEWISVSRLTLFDVCRLSPRSWRRRKTPRRPSRRSATRTSGRTSRPRSCATSWPRTRTRPKTMLYPRDPSLDPQLVWKGKDEQDRQDLAVPVVPDLHPGEDPPAGASSRTCARTAKAGEPEPQQLDLFADFNGIRRLRRTVDFYHHEQQLVEPDDPGRLAAGDDLAWPRRRASRARSRRSTSTRPTASSSARTGR